MAFFFSGRASRHVRSYFPNQGSSPCLLQWKCRVLTTELPGKSWAVTLKHKLDHVTSLLKTCQHFPTHLKYNPDSLARSKGSADFSDVTSNHLQPALCVPPDWFYFISSMTPSALSRRVCMCSSHCLGWTSLCSSYGSLLLGSRFQLRILENCFQITVSKVVSPQLSHILTFYLFLL